MRIYSVLLLCFSSSLIGLGGPETQGEKPSFFGKLTSQFTPQFPVTNIVIGHSRSAPLEPALYEMPPRPEKTNDTYTLTVNPYKELTTTKLQLINVSKIEVPEPQTVWRWTTPSNKITYEFIELIVTWNDNQKMHYLLELGTEKTNSPVKIFVETTEKLDMSKTDNMFCPGINKANLRKEGAPLPSVKELVITGHCYQKPDNASTINRSQK